MKNLRKLSRRSFMTRVVGGAVVGGGALAVLGGQAAAVQINDSDPSDPANRTGLTDRDSGDRAGNGQGTRRRGCTDADTGPNSDAPGRGRGNGTTDSDTGGNSDRPGCGRR
jgi:hypothetical protein